MNVLDSPPSSKYQSNHNLIIHQELFLSLQFPFHTFEISFPVTFFQQHDFITLTNPSSFYIRNKLIGNGEKVINILSVSCQTMNYPKTIQIFDFKVD